jgi:uncharacterized protein with PIN domain
MIDTLIYEIFKNYNQYEAVEYLNDLADAISEDGKTIGSDLKECLRDYCINEKNICPLCGEDLKLHKEKQWSEMMGKPVYEEIGYSYCENCGWSDKNE